MNWLKNLFRKKEDKKTGPWASFEVIGFEEDGRIKIGMDWNAEFITKVKALGFEAETEQDIVQLFFYTSQLRPMTLGDPEEDPVQSDEHPNLSSQNQLIRG